MSNRHVRRLRPGRDVPSAHECTPESKSDGNRRAGQSVESKTQRRGPEDIDIEVGVLDPVDAPPPRLEGAHIGAAALLFAATVATFDRCMGRISENARHPGPRVGKKPPPGWKPALDDWLDDNLVAVSEPPQ